MAITFEAVYENGVLKPSQPLPFKEHEQVQVTVQPRTGWAERTAGLLRWPGDVAMLDQLIGDPELDPQDSARSDFIHTPCLLQQPTCRE